MTRVESFERTGGPPSQSPVVISVPHAGRDYPLECAGLLRVDTARLVRLEDRYVDALALPCGAAGHTLIIARAARLWIDLNRSESELDPTMVTPTPAVTHFITPKMRSGLGLIPRRLSGVGEIWTQKLTATDVAARVALVHRPYHAAVADALAAAQRRFGGAILIDLHSMPPLAGDEAPDIVIGDRFGRAAAAQLSDVARRLCVREGFRVALNSPYAGGYIIERHARQAHNIHALQIEVDRRLYLDEALVEPGDGVARLQALIAKLADTLRQSLPLLRTEAAE